MPRRSSPIRSMPIRRCCSRPSPRARRRRAITSAPVVLETKGLKVWFPIKRGFFRKTVGHIKAVDGVDATVRSGQTLGVVGESGSGKTTLGLALLRLIRVGRSHRLHGQAHRRLQHDDDAATAQGDADRLPGPVRLAVAPPLDPADRRGGPDGAGPRHSALRASAARSWRKALTEVGLDPATMDRYPHEFSGGQRQRIAIARALALEPTLHHAGRADLRTRHVGAGPDRGSAARACSRSTIWPISSSAMT